MFWSDGPTDPPVISGPGREDGWDGAGEAAEAPAWAEPAADTGVAAGQPEAAPGPSADEQFLAAMAAEFDAIEASLVRLDDGTFDACQVCGDRIGQDRLMADPVASRCPAHS